MSEKQETTRCTECDRVLVDSVIIGELWCMYCNLAYRASVKS